jgi:hypothetical protein
VGLNAQKDMKRNLIYFIYFSGRLSQYHKLNLEYLRKYWHIFDGEIVVKIAIDGKYSIRPIMDLLPDGCDPEIVKNDPKFGESTHFLDSLYRIDSGYTFYAHCKGVSRPVMLGLNVWIKHLYNANLGSITDLSKKIFSGTCGKLIPCPPYVPQPFHYSGSFYWMDHSRVVEIASKLIFENNRHFTERFPAMVASQDECNFIEPFGKSNPNFYLAETWMKSGIRTHIQ